MSSIFDVDSVGGDDNLFEILVKAYIKRLEEVQNYPIDYDIRNLYAGIISEYKDQSELVVCSQVMHDYIENRLYRCFYLVSVFDSRYRKSQYGDRRGKPFHYDYHAGCPVTLDYITNRILNK